MGDAVGWTDVGFATNRNARGNERRQKRSDGAWDRIPSGSKAARAAPLGIRGEF